MVSFLWKSENWLPRIPLMIIILNHFGYAQKFGSQKFHGFLKASFSESADRQTHYSMSCGAPAKAPWWWWSRANCGSESTTSGEPPSALRKLMRYTPYELLCPGDITKGDICATQLSTLGEAREAREQRSTLDHDLHGSGELFQEHLPQRFLFFWHFVQAIPRAGDGLRNLLDLVPTKHGKANTLSSKLPGRETIEKIQTT